MQSIRGIVVVSLDDRVERLTKALLTAGAVPARYELDAEHIAYAVLHEADFLVTWNQKHIANPMRRRQIEEIIIKSGMNPPIILTPENLLLKES